MSEKPLPEPAGFNYLDLLSSSVPPGGWTLDFKGTRLDEKTGLCVPAPELSMSPLPPKKKRKLKNEGKLDAGPVSILLANRQFKAAAYAGRVSERKLFVRAGTVADVGRDDVKFFRLCSFGFPCNFQKFTFGDLKEIEGFLKGLKIDASPFINAKKDRSWAIRDDAKIVESATGDGYEVPDDVRVGRMLIGAGWIREGDEYKSGGRANAVIVDGRIRVSYFVGVVDGEAKTIGTWSNCSNFGAVEAAIKAETVKPTDRMNLARTKLGKNYVLSLARRRAKEKSEWRVVATWNPGKNEPMPPEIAEHMAAEERRRAGRTGAGGS